MQKIFTGSSQVVKAMSQIDKGENYGCFVGRFIFLKHCDTTLRRWWRAYCGPVRASLGALGSIVFHGFVLIVALCVMLST